MGLHFFIYPRLALLKICLSIFIGAFWWGWWWGERPREPLRSISALFQQPPCHDMIWYGRAAALPQLKRRRKLA